MGYIIMAAVALFSFLFCFIVLARVEREEDRPKPAWQDEDADNEAERISYRSGRRIRDVEDRSTPWRHDPEEDELPEEEPAERIYDLTEKKAVSVPEKKKAPAREKNSSVPEKNQKSPLLKTLEILCGILFAVALILLIWDLYLKGLH